MNFRYLVVMCILFTFLACKTDNKSKQKNSSIELSAEYMQKGEQLYKAKCMNCHLKNGKGIQNLYPPLAQSDFLKKKREESLKMVKYGAFYPIKVNGKKYNGMMPAANLSDEEISILFNYILNSWGNDYGSVSIKEVQEIKK